jgi:hypothetical protein
MICSFSLAPASAYVVSTYSDILSSSSPRFTRANISKGNFYYRAIQVVVSTSDTYTFTSTSSFNAYGCLYDGSFNPLSPSQNLIASDDDSGGSNGQFQISRSLQSGRIYILVVTTYSASITGSFSIRATGPASAAMTLFTLITSE